MTFELQPAGDAAALVPVVEAEFGGFVRTAPRRSFDVAEPEHALEDAQRVRRGVDDRELVDAHRAELDQLWAPNGCCNFLKINQNTKRPLLTIRST